jgi:hypothetical protein
LIRGMMKMALLILEHTGKSICHYGIYPTFKQSKLTGGLFARSAKVKNPARKVVLATSVCSGAGADQQAPTVI